MRVRGILQSGAFDPADVDRLQAAFDTAWNDIAAGVLDKDRVTSREQLATIIVATGNVSGLDAQELAVVAVRTFYSISSADQRLL